MASPTVVYEDRCVRLATVGINFLGVWRDPPNSARAAALQRYARKVIVEHKATRMLHVVVAGDTSPLTLPDASRKEMSDSIAILKRTPSAFAVSFQGPAFFVASWRSIMSAALLFVRPDFPNKVFGDRKLAAEWLARQPVARTAAPSAEEMLEWIAAIEVGLLPP